MYFNQGVSKYTNLETQIKLKPIQKQTIQNISNKIKILIYIKKIKI